MDSEKRALLQELKDQFEREKLELLTALKDQHEKNIKYVAYTIIMKREGCVTEYNYRQCNKTRTGYCTRGL